MSGQGKRCLSIVVPALNQEKKVGQALRLIVREAKANLDEFEIFAIDDGGSDRTGEIMEDLARDNPEIKVIHHEKPAGLGRDFREGLAKARYENYMLITGDEAFTIDSIRRVFQVVGRTDIGHIVTYRQNQSQSRFVGRFLLSKLFLLTNKTLLGMRYRDVHSLTAYPTEVLRTCDMQAPGYTYQLEVMARLSQKKVPFLEMPAQLTPETWGDSHSLRLKTLEELLETVWRCMTRK